MYKSNIDALTRKEVVELIEHCKKIIVKDQDTADSLETSDSMVEATRYLEVYYEVDKYPHHEVVKEEIIRILRSSLGTLVDLTEVVSGILARTDLSQANRNEAASIASSLATSDGKVTVETVDAEIDRIRSYYLSSYVDRNPYYRALQEKGVPVWKSRLSEDFDILSEPSVGWNSAARSFSSSYSKSRKYFTTVMYTKAFAKDMISRVKVAESRGVKYGHFPIHDVARRAIEDQFRNIGVVDPTPAAQVDSSSAASLIDFYADYDIQSKGEAKLLINALSAGGKISLKGIDGSRKVISEYSRNWEEFSKEAKLLSGILRDLSPTGLPASLALISSTVASLSSIDADAKSRIVRASEALTDADGLSATMFDRHVAAAERYFQDPESFTTTPVYETVNYYKSYCKMVICLMTIVDILNSRLMFPLDISYIDEYSMDQLLYSFGFTEFSKFPVYYRKAIVLKINTLIRHKGTDQVFVDILDIFDFRGVNIVKFYLAKYDTDNSDRALGALKPSPKFIGHSVRINSLQDAIKTEAAREYDYEGMVSGDPHWATTKEEISAQDFDFLPTKYFSIEGDFQMMKEVLNLAYFVSLVRKLKKNYTYRSYLSMNASGISQREIFLDEVILAAQIMICDFYQIEDTIHFDQEAVNKIFSFNENDNSKLNLEVVGPDALTPGTASNSAYILERIDGYSSIQRSELGAIFSKNTAVRDNFQELPNARDSRGAWKMSYETFKKYKTLYQSKFLANYNLSEYRGFSTYSEYLAERGDSELYAYVQESVNAEDKDVKREKITYILSALKEYSYTFEIPFDRLMSDMIVEYIVKTVNVFKAYTVTMKDFRVIYRWEEDSMFRMFDSETKKAGFAWDWKVRYRSQPSVPFKIGTPSGNTYVEPYPADMTFGDSILGMYKQFYDIDRIKYQDLQNFLGKFSSSGKMKYRDFYFYWKRFENSETVPFGDYASALSAASVSDKAKYRDPFNYDTAPGVDYWYRDRRAYRDLWQHRAYGESSERILLGESYSSGAFREARTVAQFKDRDSKLGLPTMRDLVSYRDRSLLEFPGYIMPVPERVYVNDDSIHSVAKSLFDKKRLFGERMELPKTERSLTDLAAFLPDRLASVGSGSVEGRILFGEGVEALSSPLAADTFRAIDRKEVSYPEAFEPSAPKDAARLTDSAASRGTDSEYELLSASDTSDHLSVLDRSDKRTMLDRFVITILQ